MKINPNLDSIYQNLVKQKSALQSEWIKWYDSLTCKPLPYYMTEQDVRYLNKLAVSPSLNCNVKEKYYLMDELMLDRGFKLCGGGTNRRAYQHVADTGTLIKLATDHVGFTSNTREFINQHVIKPFCSKMFDTTACGTVGLMECVVPIKTIIEYQKYAEAIHDMIFFVLRNNDIGMEDIGTRSFKNIGFRNDFGPVFLDYPTMYLLDPNKRYCRRIINGVMCCGTLDYDEGYNNIVCTECGRTYFAKSLARKDGEDINQLMHAVGRSVQRKESCKMKISIVDVKTGEVERSIQVTDKSGYVDPRRRRKVVDLNNPAMANPKPVKPINVKFVDVPSEPTTEEIPIVNNNTPNTPIQATDAIGNQFLSQINPILHQAMKDKHSNLTLYDLATAYNEALAEYKSFEVNTLSPAQVWERVRQDFASKLVPHKMMSEAIDLYNKLKTATADPITKRYLIDDLILSVFPAQSPQALADAFHKIINTIKNAVDLFEALVIYHNTVLNLYSFETDETMNETSYKIYTDIYNVYLEAVRTIVKDFFMNVAFSGGLVYNAKNIVSIIGRYMTNIVQVANNEMGEMDMDHYYEITTFNFAPYITIVVKSSYEESDKIHERVEPLEPIITEDDIINEERVEDPEEESSQEDLASDFEGDTLDVINIKHPVVPVESQKRMTRNQENRFSEDKKFGKGKKNKRRHKH